MLEEALLLMMYYEKDGEIINFMDAKKRFGQNFLVDQNILDKICNEINASSDDLIIEIGPGKGALTSKLKEKGANLLCYEIDTDLKPYLSKYTDDKTKIIFKDILEANIIEDIKDIKYNNLLIVGNLPYYITTPIIKKLIKLKLPVSEMIFMVQEEVADRFSAKENTKDYSAITLYLKYYYNVTKQFRVSKKSFSPIPKVESAIIKLTRRDNKPIVNEDKYFKLLEDSFRMKRKTLKNNLSEYDFNRINKILKEYNYSDLVRAEELPEEVFLAICNDL